MPLKFYICPICNQIHFRLTDNGNPMTCCGCVSEELISCMDQEDSEDHRAMIRKIGNFVTIRVGDAHPMMEVHHIQFIFLETNQGFLYKDLRGKSTPEADFILGKKEEIVNVHVLCNLHRLWSLN